MAAIAQLGTDLKIGFNGYTYTGLLMQTVDNEATGEQKVIKDENMATHTILVEDKGKRISFSAILLDTSTDTDFTIEQGDIVTVNSVLFRTESVSWGHTGEETVINFTGIAEDSMSYGP